MTQQNQILHLLHSKALHRRVLMGVGIALVLASIFLFGVLNLDFRAEALIPMFTVGIGGVFGGIYIYLMDQLRSQGGWEKAFANFSSVVVYLLLLFFSLIPGLHIVGLWD